MIPQWLKSVPKQAKRKESKFQRRPRGPSYQPLVELLEDRFAPANITSFVVNPNAGVLNTPTPVLVGSTITVNASWTASSGGTASVSIDGSQFTSGSFATGGNWLWAAPLPSLVPPQGQHTITQSVMDNAGTDTESRQIIVYSDYNAVASSTATTTVYGQLITLTGDANALTPGATASFAGGRMELWLDGNLVGNNNPNTAGQLTYNTASLTPGNHTFFARYYGDNINYSRGFVFNGINAYNPSFPYAESAPITITVGLAPTTTVLVSSANPSTPGQNVTFTATVTANSPSTFTPNGTVTFFVDGVNTGSTVALVNGVASFSTNTLSLGNHTVLARYDGNNQFIFSVSNTVNQAVRASTTTTITSSLNPAFSGQNVEFSAVVTGFDPDGGVPTGTITFRDVTGGFDLGVVALSNGTATYNTSTLTTGNRTITATYNPGADPRFGGSTSANLVQTTIETPTSVALSASSTSTVQGQPVALTAVVSSLVPVNPIPGGTIQFYDNGVAIGSAVTVQGGTASFVLTNGTAGNHQFTAIYTATAAIPGNDFANATSAPVVTTIGKADTTTALATSPNPANLGAAVTLTATVASVLPGTGTPTGSVTFFNNGVSLGTGALNASGVATLSVSNLPGGTVNLTATYGGSTTFNGSSAAATQIVNLRATTTTVASSALNAVAGANVTFTATVSAAGGVVSGLPLTGTVTFFDGSTELGTVNVSGTGAVFTTNTLAIGSHAITAAYSGNASYDASTSAAITQMIGNVVTTTAVVSSSLSAVEGATVTFTATVTPTGGIIAGLPLTGTVTFMDGTTALGTADVSGTGVATLNTNTLTVGTHPITAIYAGNTTYAGSTSTVINQTITVAPVNTSLFLESSLNPSVFGQIVTFTATVVAENGDIPFGSVTFFNNTVPASPVQIGVATLTDGKASINLSALSVSTGTPILARYSTTGKYQASQGTLNQTVNAAATTTALVASTNTAALGDTVTFTATVSVSAPGVGPATGTVQFGFTGPTTFIGLGTVNSAGVATYTTSALALGTYSVTATYNATPANFTNSSSAPVQVIVNKATPAAVVTSSVNPANVGNDVTLTATITPTSTTSPAPSGTVTFFSDGAALATVAIPSAATGAVSVSTTVNNLAIGDHQITATYNGNANYNTVTSAPLTQTIQGSRTATTLTSTPASPTDPGESFVLEAAVAYSGPVGQEPATPLTGTVVFKDGSTVLGTVTLDAAGLAAYSITNPTAGNHAYTAEYSGDTLYEKSAATINHVVQKGESETTITGSTTSAVYGRSVTFTASVAGIAPATAATTGSVTFYDSFNGGTATAIGTGTIKDGVATLTTSSLAKGNHVITAVYGGDSNYNGSESEDDPFEIFISVVPFIFTR